MRITNDENVLILPTTTPNTIKVLDSWFYLNIGKTEVIYYDQIPVGVKDIERIRPVITILFGAHRASFCPPLEELKAMNAIAPLIMILFDGGDPPWHEEIIRMRDAFTSIVSIDGNPNWPQREQDITLLTPIDPRYYGENLLRDILAGFGGGQGDGRRGSVYGHLKGRGLLTQFGYDPISSYKGYNGERASYKLYADNMRRCKFVVNNSMTAHGLAHVKGRVLEAGLAQACLLEDKNPITPLWFEPGKHYIEYDGPEHAAQLIQQLNSEPEHIEQIARALYEEVVGNHSPKIFWGKVLDKIDRRI